MAHRRISDVEGLVRGQEGKAEAMMFLLGGGRSMWIRDTLGCLKCLLFSYQIV